MWLPGPGAPPHLRAHHGLEPLLFGPPPLTQSPLAQENSALSPAPLARRLLRKGLGLGLRSPRPRLRLLAPESPHQLRGAMPCPGSPIAWRWCLSAATALARSSGPRKKAQGSDHQPQNSVLPDLLPSAAQPKLRVEKGTATPHPPGTPCYLRTQGRELDSKWKAWPQTHRVGGNFRGRPQPRNLWAPTPGALAPLSLLL